MARRFLDIGEFDDSDDLDEIARQENVADGVDLYPETADVIERGHHSSYEDAKKDDFTRPATKEIESSQKADGERRDEWGFTELAYAAGNGNAEKLNALIAQGKNVESKSNVGMTPLMVASMDGNSETRKILFEKGVNIDEKMVSGKTALILAGQRGNSEALQELLDHGADIDAVDNDGATALSWAADRGNKEAVEVLIENGADIDIRNSRGRTAIDDAKTAEIRDILIKAKEKADKAKENPNTETLGNLKEVKGQGENFSQEERETVETELGISDSDISIEENNLATSSVNTDGIPGVQQKIENVKPSDFPTTSMENQMQSQQNVSATIQETQAPQGDFGKMQAAVRKSMSEMEADMDARMAKSKKEFDEFSADVDAAMAKSQENFEKLKAKVETAMAKNHEKWDKRIENFGKHRLPHKHSGLKDILAGMSKPGHIFSPHTTFPKQPEDKGKMPDYGKPTEAPSLPERNLPVLTTFPKRSEDKGKMPDYGKPTEPPSILIGGEKDGFRSDIAIALVGAKKGRG